MPNISRRRNRLIQVHRNDLCKKYYEGGVVHFGHFFYKILLWRRNSKTDSSWSKTIVVEKQCCGSFSWMAPPAMTRPGRNVENREQKVYWYIFLENTLRKMRRKNNNFKITIAVSVNFNLSVGLLNPCF